MADTFLTGNPWKQTAQHPQLIEPQDSSIVAALWQGSGLRDLFQDNRFVEVISQVLDRHKSLTVLLAWLSMLVLDYCSYVPTEWFFFTYFTFTVLSQSVEFGFPVLLLFSVLMVTADLIIYWTIPFGYLCLASSGVVYAFLVNGFHGLDARGWMLSAIITVARLYIPWYTVLPPSFMAPIAAHCTAFGLCWLLYRTIYMLYTSFDQVCAMFGVMLPQAPVITVRNITDCSFNLFWCVPLHGNVSKHVIEINGVLAGESDQRETSVAIVGLSPTTEYVVRVWAVSDSDARTPSPFIHVRTLGAMDPNFITEQMDTLAATDDYSHNNIDSNVAKCSMQVNTDTTKGRAANNQQKNAKTTMEKGSSPVAITTSSNGNENTTMITPTDEDIQKLRDEIDRIIMLNEGVENSIVELKTRYEIESKQLSVELDELRQQRKHDEEARSKLRSTLKTLDEQRHELDSIKNKREREIRSETNLARQMRDTCQSKEREIRTLKENTLKHHNLTVSSKKQLTEQKECMDGHIRAVQQELKEAQRQLAELNSQYSEQSRKAKELRAQLTQIHTETEQLDRLMARPDKRKQQHVKQERRELYDKCAKLQEEGRQLQETLREVTREKVSLMEALTRMRRGDQDNTGNRDNYCLPINRTSTPTTITTTTSNQNSRVSPLLKQHRTLIGTVPLRPSVSANELHQQKNRYFTTPFDLPSIRDGAAHVSLALSNGGTTVEAPSQHLRLGLDNLAGVNGDPLTCKTAGNTPDLLRGEPYFTQFANGSSSNDYFSLSHHGRRNSDPQIEFPTMEDRKHTIWPSDTAAATATTSSSTSHNDKRHSSYEMVQHVNPPISSMLSATAGEFWPRPRDNTAFSVESSIIGYTNEQQQQQQHNQQQHRIRTGTTTLNGQNYLNNSSNHSNGNEPRADALANGYLSGRLESLRRRTHGARSYSFGNSSSSSNSSSNRNSIPSDIWFTNSYESMNSNHVPIATTATTTTAIATTTAITSATTATAITTSAAITTSSPFSVSPTLSTLLAETDYSLADYYDATRSMSNTPLGQYAAHQSQQLFGSTSGMSINNYSTAIEPEERDDLAMPMMTTIRDSLGTTTSLFSDKYDLASSMLYKEK